MKSLGVCLYVVSVILAIVGFVTMYRYGNYDSNYPSLGDSTGHIVGGDAYNYMIIGVRGLGYIGAGILSAVVGSGCLIFGIIEDNYRLNKKLKEQTIQEVSDITSEIETA
ncbi:hypothetical protein PP175_26970 (plasmid) [Aneurinibacillus sp. Ricciae_BoGa-3]|uniref:hypothetical protein n=1 Tax=Aneurinibacillus sp. Ricciae_BoGa-3 TaxID=3022697 RepID=UPI0023418F9D|nr:hypothetical protein [Aneurinibacillus sp. Ricciae_BoGa-3]WCK57681.1 hypothetical protein PP175_26970 [Aneurinibacillus sp. Ricciae_BoGa-3]